MKSIYLIIAVVILVIFLFSVLYNQLVRLQQWVNEAWSQIDVQLQRRNDLIPNLVETVKGYTEYEKNTLVDVVKLRNQLSSLIESKNTTKEEIIKVSDQLGLSLKSIIALSENYPDLKASTNYSKLQEELTNTENKIAYSRQLYNSSAANYNIKLKTFPSNVVANVFGFGEERLIFITEDKKNVPKIQF
ncbi:LemA family protein [Enterococcus faecalis]|uniref:LemA family protein n=1 Tax=Enterococcus TaxID=1350 RepID=UPI001A970E0E|nr:LemA family protein [Enterococcus faecalis]MBO1125369.1 LemA family protein [Enterococcus faecalis]